jgi:glycosyltransferase involved in cell wall biosynthesis
MDNMISVIIPVYKVEAYLRECAESVINQTYKNLEIILVDDGSPDGCPQMCDDFARSDGRVRVIHKTNGGLFSARNAGLDAATGDFVTFLDADDYLSPGFCESLMKLASETNADVAACRLVCTYQNGEEAYPVSDFIGDNAAAARKILVDMDVTFSSIVNKIIKRGLFTGLRFREMRQAEDVMMSYDLLSVAEKYACTADDRAAYHYRMRGGSMMHNFSRDRYFALRACEKQIELLNARFPAEAGAGELRRMNLRYEIFHSLMFTDGYKRRSDYRELLREMKADVPKLLKSPFAGRQSKIKALIFGLNADWYAGMMRRKTKREQAKLRLFE